MKEKFLGTMYSIKETFYSLQGEGAHTGRPAIFLRFAGCNLWSGREQDRESAICRFCDTDFVGVDGQNGGKFSTATELAEHVNNLWPIDTCFKYVICTGGEPGLQLDEELIEKLKQKGFEVAIETNGTVQLPSNIDWICLSPKGSSEVLLSKVNELKLVFPQDDAPPERFKDIQADVRYLSPKNPFDGSISINQSEATQAAITYCLKNPQWRLCLQTHKILNID